MKIRSGKLSILIIDDHPIFRKGLARLLKDDGSGRFDIIDEAGDRKTALEKLDSADYKKIMEEILLEVTGKKIPIYFEVKKDIQPKIAKLQVKSEPIVTSKAKAEELSPFAKRAEAVFGGKIEKE